MRVSFFRRLLIIAFVSLVPGLVQVATAELAPRPFLSPIFGDHMVLQRGRPAVLWGWAPPAAVVRVGIAGKAAEAQAGPDGKWRVALELPSAGGPYELTLDGPQHLVLRDVLVGDVWLCGGQSNMAFALQNARDGEAEVAAADLPWLRLYTVPTRSAYAPADVPQGAWKVCSPASAGSFSAVAYFFARRLERELHVPIGLVQDCLGGSPAESWISARALAQAGEFAPQLAEIRRLHERGGPEFGSFLMHWLADNDVGGRDDAWARVELDDRDWKPLQIPGGFAELGVAASPSVCWFRREIVLPDKLPAGPAKLYLGSVEKMDTSYLNGRWIGASSWVENPRVYPIPDGVLHPGRNLVAVRVFKLKPDGGFLAPPETLRIAWEDGTTMPLAGAWRGRLSVDARPPHPLPLDWENYPTMPTVLYDGMIAPLAPLSLAGAIWYQGEANTARAQQYRTLLPALIADWRATFERPELPFYLVSLPAFMARRPQPGSDGWAELREVQADTVRSVPHTGLAVTIDTGEAENIHPHEKRPVGERLAALALAQQFGLDVPCAGPTFRAVEKLPGALRLRFDHADGGLVVRGERLGEFVVAGADRAWHWAQARIEGDAVVVSAADVSEPVAARYAWQGNPLATLFNGAGLPAAPFRTDNWPTGSAQ